MMLDLKLTFLALMGVGWLSGGVAQGQIVSGINVPSGFEVTKVADDHLATNIFCMAVSPRGETFVSGPGYIKQLLDSDGDGRFDSVSVFSNGPRTGAQGMCFDGNDLLCTGDGGLLRFVDADGDRVADGPPELVFPIKTGGEHHAHAIRKGPDGWWYVLAGNQTPIQKEYYAGLNSPVVKPRAGFLMRISPDWKTKEIFAHGFRNAYDFDFNSLGEVFVYDSDGERDISLPWYRPTRLFLMRAGDDAGWVSAGWKRPSSFFDMPIEIGALGRGSPTGVVVGHSTQFPESYDDAIFVADWTFGRVTVFRRNGNDVTGESARYDRGSAFAIADGQFGFAVTDLDFASDGSLLISVGGRGTQGGIYRVSFSGERSEGLASIDPDRESIKRIKSERLPVEDLIKGLNSSNRRVRNAALEALVGRQDIGGGDSDGAGFNSSLAEGIIRILDDCQPQTAALALRVIRQSKPNEQWKAPGRNEPIDSAWVGVLLAMDNDDGKGGQRIKAIVENLVTVDQVDSDRNFGFRIAQLVVGGCGAPNADQMFVGYTARNPIELSRIDRAAIADRLATFMMDKNNNVPIPANSESGLDEAGRLAAMLGCGSKSLQTAMANLLDRENATATQDIHWLNCFSQTSNPDGLESLTVKRIAGALTGIGRKIKRDRLNLDRNFYPRMRSLAQSLFQMDDGDLARQVANSIEGSEGDVYLLGVLPERVRGIALRRIAEWVNRHPDDVTAGQIEILGADGDGRYLSLIRSFASRRELKAVVIRALARNPQQRDRDVFVKGLAAMDAGTVKGSAIALRRIHSPANSEEVLHGLLAAGRFGWDKQSVSVRDQLMLMLKLHSGDDFGYRSKQPDVNQAAALKRWLDWANQQFPDKFSAIFDRAESIGLENRMEAVDWDSGRQARGAQVYQRLQCAQCHDAGSRLGPRLEGVASRFDREDLFRTIVVPSRQVAPRYRAILIETADGQFFKGSVVYESVDGITLQEPGGNTVRINQDDIESRAVSEKSLMPDGLLNEASNQDWADLYAFLKSR